MKRNTASQTIGAQLVSATDGSAVTSGTTTVYVTGDGGTQAQGSGTVAHEGNGYWSYAPTQAETNFDHVAFTFVNSSAITATVQVYTTFPQTGDSFARLGAPAGASIAADIAEIEAQTDDIGAAGAGLTAIPWSSAWDAEVRAAVGLLSANLDTQLSTIDGNVDAIKVKTDSLTFSVSGQVDANMQSINDVALTGDGSVGNEFTVAA